MTERATDKRIDYPQIVRSVGAEKLAKQLGVHISTAFRWQRGEAKPREPQVYMLVALGYLSWPQLVEEGRALLADLPADGLAPAEQVA